MIKEVLRKDEPFLFRDITEFSIEDNKEHRRGSNFFTSHIIEFKDEDAEYFPEISDFEKYVGFWKTDTYIWDSEYGSGESPSKLTRVNKVEEQITVIKWQKA